jgi:hypothetical protein
MALQAVPKRHRPDAQVEVAIHHEGRDADAGIVSRRQGAFLPPGVEGRVRQGVLEVLEEGPFQRTSCGRADRPRSHALQHLCLCQDGHDAGEARAELVQRVDLQQAGPVQCVLPPEGTAAIRDLAEEIDAGNRGRDAAQMRRACGRGGQLGHGHIAAAIHADGTAAPGLRGDPLDRVETVATLVRRIEAEFAFTLADAADLLDHDRIARLDVAQHAQALEAHDRLLVGRAQQDGRNRFIDPRQPDIRVESHAVAHRQRQPLVRRRHWFGRRQRRTGIGAVEHAEGADRRADGRRGR